LRDDTATFLDLGMAVLGAEPADYDIYEAGIAAEYIQVHGLNGFRAGRAAFLRGMLSRE
jgi:predicted metal-dependent HD superfamily phosphohydrolase